MARLDRLAPVKEVAQIAACIGREFGHELLRSVTALDEHALQRALNDLMTAELIFPPAGSNFAFGQFREPAMMQPFSQSISQIAGALARAQAELQNPEKSLTAHHRLAPSRGKKAAASAMRHWRAGWRSCASA
jgi:hypothetical protein